MTWGIAYPDAVRTVWPGAAGKMDRGRALEAAWNRDGTLGVPLSQWREGVQAGWRPATVFNATIAETGERLLFSTTGFAGAAAGRHTFDALYPAHDVSVVTAARLSATFPYVTPAARADIEGDTTPPYHVVDGGYYDNYGMSTLAEWLDQALKASGGSIKNVLVIQIRGAPGGNDNVFRFADEQAMCPQKAEKRFTARSSRGWFYQLYAPFATLLRVRDTGQGAHNDVEFKLLQRTWQAQGVAIDTVTFQYPGADTPLSWHLTARQQSDIERFWQAELQDCSGQQNWNKVERFLAPIAEQAAAKPAADTIVTGAPSTTR